MSLWSALLIFVTVGLFVLPLLPALAELSRPTDIAPLRVVQAYDNNPLHFADGFRNYISSHFGQADAADIHGETNGDGTLADGTHYQRVGMNGQVNLGGKRATDRLLFSSHALTLPDQGMFASEIFAGLGLATGISSQFRALMSNESLSIGDDSTVWRWAHSDGDMQVGRNATLHGRVTSRKNITLGIGCHFERLHAAKIITGAEPMEPATVPAVERIVLEELKDVKSKAGRRSVLEGDLNFPANHIFDGDIVAGSTAVIGDHAHIKGSIKSNALNDITHYLHTTGVLASKVKGSARCVLGHHVQIDGAIVSTHDLFIGQHCRITGPVIAENLLVIRTGTVIGSPSQPCTVTAPEIIIESGCVVYGSLWATRQGTVKPALHRDEEIAA